MTIYYHGSPHLFDTFDYSRIRTHGTSEGVGFYFTDDERIARTYGENGYLYTVRIEQAKPLSDTQKTLRRDELEQFLRILHHTPGVDMLSNYGDFTYEDFETILARAVENEYNYADTDTEIIGSIYNACGENPDVLIQLYEQLGYDHITTKPLWGGDQKIIVALSPKTIEIIDVRPL